MAEKKTYIEAIGRRKTATARVRITPSKERTVVVNEKALETYFASKDLAATVLSVFEVGTDVPTVSVSAKVVGGGISAQAEAIRLGIARALIADVPARRTPLKEKGYLKRDPRAKERRKFGLKKARKRAQWSKR
ncbi:MAG: ribosomal protein [Candidatus Parcubacteria bacterium]|jgi:small subunit ribosomal protein S9